MKIRVIVNRGGGTVQGFKDDALKARLECLFSDNRADAEVRLVPPEELGSEFEAAASAPDLDAVAAGGGDGTIRTAAAALAGTPRPLGILPLGTLNHFARDAGVPTKFEDAAAVIAAGHVRAVDLGEVNGRVFVNNSALGIYPEMVRERESQQHRLGRSKRLAMLIASLRTMRSFSSRRLTIRIGGREEPVETPLLFVGNNRYEISLQTLGRREAIDRGELCLYAPVARTRLQFLRLALRGLAGRHDQARDFISLNGVREAEIQSRRAFLNVATDGETERMETPLRYRIRPKALRLIVPRESPAP